MPVKILIFSLFIIPLFPILAVPNELELEGEVGLGVHYFPSTGKLKDQNIVELEAESQFSEGIRAILAAEFRRLELDWDTIATEANLEFQISKHHVWAIIGKQDIPFGQQFLEEAFQERDQLENPLSLEKYLGVALLFSDEGLKSLRRLLDSLEIAFFENESDQWTISDDRGVAIRLRRLLSENIIATGSAVTMLQSNQFRGSLGIVYSPFHENFTLGMEIGHITGHPLNGTDWVHSLGASVRLSDRATLKGRYGNFRASGKQLVLGIDYNIREDIALGFEINWQIGEYVGHFLGIKYLWGHP